MSRSQAPKISIIENVRKKLLKKIQLKSSVKKIKQGFCLLQSFKVYFGVTSKEGFQQEAPFVLYTFS